MNLLAVAVALGAAAFFAVSTSVQHRSVAQTPHSVQGGRRLVLHLLGNRTWLAGTGASVAGFVLHALALRLGTLTVVQPVLVSGLVFTLPVRSLLDRQRPSRRELAGAAVTAVGLTLFIVFSRPTGGEGLPDTLPAALLLAGGSLAAVAAALSAARLGASRTGGILLGFAAGELSGLAAGLLKVSTGLLVDDPWSLFVSWAPYVLVLLALWGLTLNQRAYRSAPLAVTLPTFNVVDPLAGIAFGILVFDERPSVMPLDLVVEILGLVLMFVGAAALARSTPMQSASPEDIADATA